MSKPTNKPPVLIYAGLGLLALISIIVILALNTNQSFNKSELTQTPAETATISSEDKIKSAVNGVFSLSETDKGLNKVESITIAKTGDGNYTVEVNINSDSYQGLPLLETESSKIYRSLYSSDLGVKNATVNAYHEFSDEYGNRTNEKVLTTELNQDVASKINFDADDTDLDVIIIPRLWVKSFENHKNGY